MSVLGNLIKGFKHITDYTHTHTHIIITEDVGEEVTLHALLTLSFLKFTKLFSSGSYRSEEVVI